MPKSFEKMGGWSALICAATYIFGFAVLVGPISATGFGSAEVDTPALLAYLSDNSTLMGAWYLTIYVVNGIFLALLVLALEDRATPKAPNGARIIRTIGHIWATLVVGAGMAANVGLAKTVAAFPTDPAKAEAIWRTTELIETGIGGGNEILGGLLALVIGTIALVTRFLPRLLALFGVVIGIAGLLTVFSPLEPIAAPVFGLGYIAWFIWTGVVLLMSPAAE